jgi:hypothetical protein
LSQKISEIKKRIIELNIPDMEKVHNLLMQFGDALLENCRRIKDEYERHDCNEISIEPAVGFFVPNVDEKDAILHGAEPSAIVTAKDLTEQGLHKFLRAAGDVGKKYFQQAEILKFPIQKERFDNYFEHKLNADSQLIGALTGDGVIATFEIIVDLQQLFKPFADLFDDDNYLENFQFYVNIITELAKEKYAASTWPTTQREFSTIFIKNWEGGGREFSQWYTEFRSIIERFSQKDPREMERGDPACKEQSVKRENRPQGYRLIREFIIIPQNQPNILPGCNILYKDLINDKKRAAIVKKLLSII